MSRTPERTLAACRRKWQAKRRETFTATCHCGTRYNPKRGSACSGTCVEALIQLRARSA